MSALGTPVLFNALAGNEVKEIILRKVRETFDKDERFRQHATYPNVKFKFSCSLAYEPGMAEAVNLSGNIDAKAKIQAQADLIATLEKQLAEHDDKFHEIESQANLLISDNEKKTRDLADANEFFRRFHAEKLELEKTLTAAANVRKFDEDAPFQSTVNPVFDLDALTFGGEILVEHESETIEEPDRLRESGETLSPAESIEIEVEGSGEAQGEQIPQMAVVGRQPSEVTNIDRSLKLPTEGTGATVAHGRPPGSVKGRPRG